MQSVRFAYPAIKKSAPERYGLSGFFWCNTLSVIKLLCLIDRLACEVDAELMEHIEINGTHHGGGVCITVCEIAYLLHCKLGDRIGGGTDRKSDENFIGMKSRVVITHVIYLKVGDRLDDIG